MKDKLNKVLNILIAIAVLFLICVVVFMLVRTDSGAEKYQKGLEFFNQEDYQNAYYNFVRVSDKSKYYPYALFRQGMCAEKLGDKETQAQKFEEYAKKYDNIFTTEAAFKSGIAYYNNEQYNEAQKVLKRAVKENKIKQENSSDFAIAANYYLGEIEKNKNQKSAINYYLKYLENSSNGRYSKQSAQAVNELLKQNPKIELTEKQKFYIASALYYAQDYTTAQEFFEKISDSTGWYLKAENYIKLGQNEKALDILQTGLTKNYKNIDEKDLSKALNSFAKIYSLNSKDGWQILFDMLSNVTDFPLKDEIYYNVKEYNQIYLEKLSGKYASKAVYDLFFEAYNKRNYNLARVYAISYIERFPNEPYAAKVLYYLGCIYEKIFKKAEAIQAYNRLRVNYPDTFWAFRAYIKTDAGKSPFAKWQDIEYAKIDVPQRQPNFPYAEIELSKNDAMLLNDLIKLKDYDLIEKIAPDNLAIKSWTNFYSGNYSLSIVNARNYLNLMKNKPDFQDDLYILAYPILYKAEINKYAELHNLNAYLIEALIREESYFNPKAQSPVGALGLMQLMPATASFIAKKEINKNQLFEPEYNIYLGTKYYKYIKTTLSNNNIYAVLAYNGGPGAVQRWVEKHNSEHVDEFLENIPFDETQNYIFKVYKSYWNYLNIYASDKL